MLCSYQETVLFTFALSTPAKGLAIGKKDENAGSITYSDQHSIRWKKQQYSFSCFMVLKPIDNFFNEKGYYAPCDWLKAPFGNRKLIGYLFQKQNRKTLDSFHSSKNWKFCNGNEVEVDCWSSNCKPFNRKVLKFRKNSKLVLTFQKIGTKGKCCSICHIKCFCGMKSARYFVVIAKWVNLVITQNQSENISHSS